ncbi:MAG TPA: JAB domain-containing protein [Ruminococcus sp.]|nr:JAB domain-containing protein [Ruminococcus sp.]
MNNKNVHADHRKRICQRFLDTEGAGFSSHELLEILLFGSIPRANTNPTAHRLIERFGSVENILTASEKELLGVKGIGLSSARLITVMAEACRRFRESTSGTSSFGSREELYDHILKKADNFTKPVCMLVFINADLSLNGIEIIPVTEMLGSPNLSRLLSAYMLRNGRERLVSVFVHPDSPPIPSPTDYQLTKAIASVSSSLRLTLLDSLITGYGKYFSMKSTGAFSFLNKGGFSYG